MTHFAALLQRDLRVIARDGFLVMMAGYSLLLAAVARIAVRYVPIDHVELYVAPFVIITACGLIGLVFGFALIEERETKTWLLMRVLPISQTTTMLYWILTVGGSCLVISLASALIYGVQPARLVALLVFVAVAAMGAPAIMLLLGALASNKIEGLAVSKIISGSSLVLVAVFVLPARWHFVLFWYPWYWVYRGLLDAYAGPELSTGLAVTWPVVPIMMQVAVPLAATALGIMRLTRRYRSAA